jgi:hypothetical protein
MCLTKHNVNSSNDVTQLLTAFKNLNIDCSGHDTQDYRLWTRVHLRNPSIHRRVRIFLMELETTAHNLGLPMVSRKYRHTFTHNYRALMPADKRIYRVDVLEAGQDGHNVLWVNGTRYLLPDEVLSSNNKFQKAWGTLLQHLQQICDDMEKNLVLNVNWILRLGLPLIQFDLCWTEFERHYIEALMVIEKQARSVLMECLHINEEIKHYEDLYQRLVLSLQNGTCYEPSITMTALNNLCLTIRTSYQSFIKYLAQLNARANTKRKGRSDLHFSILDTAAHIVCEIEHHENKFNACQSNTQLFRYPWTRMKNLSPSNIMPEHWTHASPFYILQVLSPLAEPLLEDLQGIRNIMTTLSLCPERIDPHLGQNQLLVESLVQFESQWDDAWAYLDNKNMLDSFTTFLCFLHQILELETKYFHFPEETNLQKDTLEERIASLDVSAFLTLSRLAVLFCVTPNNSNNYNFHLLKSLLPDTFETLSFSTTLCQNIKEECTVVEEKQFSTKTSLITKSNTPAHPLGTSLSHLSSPTFSLRSSLDNLTPVLNDIPVAFHSVVIWGNRICKLSLKENIQCDDLCLDMKIFLCILQHCIVNNEIENIFLDELPEISELKHAILRFTNSLEESSIILQRTNPKEWNSFLQTTFKCLVAFRSTMLSSIETTPHSSEKKCDVVLNTTTSDSPALSRCSTASFETTSSPSNHTYPTRSKLLCWLDGSATPTNVSFQSPRQLPSFPRIMHF